MHQLESTRTNAKHQTAILQKIYYISGLSGRTIKDFTVIGRLWLERREQRIALGQLDPAQLADLGLTSAAARAEASKPFWRP